jgi:hypothetical protein
MSQIKKIPNFNFDFIPKSYKLLLKDSILIQREKDIIEITTEDYLPYLNILREEYQVTLNQIKNKYLKKVIKYSNHNKDLIETGAQEELKVYQTYIEKVNLYLYGKNKKKNLESFNKQTINDEIVFVVDISWSMYDILSFKKIKLIFNYIKNIYSIINILNLSKTKISIVEFGQEASVVIPLSSSKVMILLKLMSLIPQNGFAFVFSWIFKIDKYHNDNISLGLRTAASQLLLNGDENSEKSILVFSDGKLDGVDSAQTEYALKQKEKLEKENLENALKEVSSFKKYGIKLYTYQEKENKVLNELSDKNLTTNNILDKVFYNIQFDNDQKSNIRLKNKKVTKYVIPRLTMYFQNIKQMKEGE